MTKKGKLKVNVCFICNETDASEEHHVKEYLRGGDVKIIIISPDKSEEDVNTYASKKGDIYTLFQITKDSQFGIHQVILKYNGAEIASTSFEILDNRSDFERWKDNNLK